MNNGEMLKAIKDTTGQGFGGMVNANEIVTCGCCKFGDSTWIESRLFCTNESLDSSDEEYAVMVDVPPTHFCGYGEKNDN